MKSVIEELNSRRESIGMSVKELAAKTGKDTLTVVRQLDLSSNPTLETLNQYAAALHGTIHFFPEQWDAILRIDETEAVEMRKQLTANAEEIGALRRENELLQSRVTAQQEILTARLQMIEQLTMQIIKINDKLAERI